MLTALTTLHRVAFDDGTTSVIKPSERAIAFEWQTLTCLGKISEIDPELQACKA